MPVIRNGAGEYAEYRNFREARAAMDFLKIINIHIMWKERLLAYIEDRSAEKLDPAVIARDDQCQMGKWIYGEGKRFQDAPQYEQVRADHAHFHDLAANVIRRVDNGDRQGAAALLRGDYATASHGLKRAVIALSLKVRDEGD